jgi:chromosome segregation ATPase
MEKYDAKDAETLLNNKWSIEDFEEVKQWDQRARSEIMSIDSLIQHLHSDLHDHQTKQSEISEDLKSKPLLVRPWMLIMGTGLQKTKRKIKQIIEEVNRITEIKNQLQGWIDATPDDRAEADDVITELKLSKKQIDINKKELQLQIKQINIDTDQKVKKIEKRIFFTSPRLKRLQIDKAQKKEESNINPLQQALLDLDSQELEVDKMILWYEKIKYSK